MLAELCMDAAEDASTGRSASFQPQQENLHTHSAQVCSRHRLPTRFKPWPSHKLLPVSKASREGQT